MFGTVIATAYGIAAYQPMHYRTDSIQEVEQVVAGLLPQARDEYIEELRSRAKAVRR